RGRRRARRPRGLRHLRWRQPRAGRRRGVPDARGDGTRAREPAAGHARAPGAPAPAREPGRRARRAHGSAGAPARRPHPRARGRLGPVAGGWHVLLDSGEWLDADAVVIATSAAHAAGLLAPVDDALARELAGFPQAGLGVVAMAFRAADVPRPLDGYGYLAAR